MYVLSRLNIIAGKEVPARLRSPGQVGCQVAVWYKPGDTTPVCFETPEEPSVRGAEKLAKKVWCDTAGPIRCTPTGPKGGCNTPNTGATTR